MLIVIIYNSLMFIFFSAIFLSRRSVEVAQVIPCSRMARLSEIC